MGPDEDSTRPAEDRESGKPPGRRPRTRCCLLKGCERRFRPQRAAERYCSDECRCAGRQWSRWKAKQSYRAMAAGRERRNRQSRRYRQRVRNRQPAVPQEAVPDAARIITPNFFRLLLRPSWCYEGFDRQRRSPHQRFCSRACRRAMERVWKRERRGRRAMQRQ